MRFKLLKHSWLSAAVSALVISGVTLAGAAPTLTPYGVPNTVNLSVASVNTVYYLDKTFAVTTQPAQPAGTTAEIVPIAGSTSPAYPQYNFAGGDQITLAVNGHDITGANGFFWVYASDSADANFTPVPIATCSGFTTGAGYCQVPLGTGAFTLTISLQALCQTSVGFTISGCQPGTAGVAIAQPGAGAGSPPALFHLWAVDSNASTPVAATTGTGAAGTGSQFDIGIEVTAPILSYPDTVGFFPGDSEILIETSSITATATNGGSPVFQNVYPAAAENPATLASGNEVGTSTVPIQTFTFGSGEQEVTGFQNSTASDFVTYQLGLGVSDSAGGLVFIYPLFNNVYASEIDTFLKKSNCFVATASYRDGDASGVMLLRHFRDRVLVHSKPGRKFIAWYYAKGPIAADWLMRYPAFRSVSLLFLMPLQAIAWVTLHPMALFVPLAALFLLLILLFPSGAWMGIAFITAAGLLSPRVATATDQPYIDSLISELPKEQFPPANSAHPDPYIQSIKKKIGPSDDSTGYSESLKKEAGTSDGSEGYSNRIKKGLPPASGSAIEDFKKGKQLHANKGSLDTRSAFGFELMVSATRTYSAGSDEDADYTDVYGNGWIPDFTLHYEWRPFTASLLKKFGMYASAGFAYNKAQGQFAFTPAADPQFSTSKTALKFIELPLDVGLIYRFSLFDFIWPYFAGGPSAIGFIESRDDKQPSHHGYDFGYWFMGGVAFGLDWISAKNSWDQYEAAGIKHSYFTIDYSYLQSLGGGIVDFTVDGVGLGFTFEL